MLLPQGALARHRRPIAIGVALLLHAVVLWGLMRPSSGQLGIDANLGASQTGIPVAFFTPEATGDTEMHAAPQSRPPTPPLTKALDRFSDMAQTAEPSPPLKAAQPSQSLEKVFGKDLFDQAPKAAQTPKPSDAHIEVAGSMAPSLNDLWKTIAPCWHRLADKQATGVRLSVSFSILGNLSKPPVIVRQPGTSLSDRQLRSESLAITALSQCGPYPMAFGQSNVTVDFPAGG